MERVRTTSESRAGGAVRLLSVVFIAAFTGLSSGCAYMANRGNDVLEVLDLGVVYSNHWRPDFALFGNLFNVLPLGYANVDGKVVGLANGRVGVERFVTHNSWGVLLWGAEQKQVGEADEQGAEKPPRYALGLVPLIGGTENGPPGHTYAHSDRVFYLGWIGLYAMIRFDELADFFIGWSGMDIMNDDGARVGVQ
jgi:hypothetical protein